MERSQSLRESQQRYYQKNREKLLAKQKAYDDAHREEIRERFKRKKYYAKEMTPLTFISDEEFNDLIRQSSNRLL